MGGGGGLWVTDFYAMALRCPATHPVHKHTRGKTLCLCVPRGSDDGSNIVRQGAPEVSSFIVLCPADGLLVGHD